MSLKKQVEEAFEYQFSSENNLEVDIDINNRNNTLTDIRLLAYRASDYEEVIASVDLIYLPDKRKMEIQDIQVNGEFQSEGYGRRIVEAIENASEELGAESVHAIDSINDSFWIYMGYSEFGSEFKKYV